MLYLVLKPVNTEVVIVGTIEGIGKIETTVVVEKEAAVVQYTYFEPMEMVAAGK